MQSRQTNNYTQRTLPLCRDVMLDFILVYLLVLDEIAFLEGLIFLEEKKLLTLTIIKFILFALLIELSTPVVNLFTFLMCFFGTHSLAIMTLTASD